MPKRIIVIEADSERKLDEFMEDVESMGYDVKIEELPNEPPEPEGTIDHDDEDRRAYREELNERPRPSDY